MIPRLLLYYPVVQYDQICPKVFKTVLTTSITSVEYRSWCGGSMWILKSFARMAGQPKIWSGESSVSVQWGQLLWLRWQSGEIFILFKCLVLNLAIVVDTARSQFRTGMECFWEEAGSSRRLAIVSVRVRLLESWGASLASLATVSFVITIDTDNTMVNLFYRHNHLETYLHSNFADQLSDAIDEKLSWSVFFFFFFFSKFLLLAFVLLICIFLHCVLVNYSVFLPMVS